MTSPESSVSGGLRRRGRDSISDTGGHARTTSDGFGSFVDASTLSAFDSDLQHSAAPVQPPSYDPGLSESFDAPAPTASAPTPFASPSSAVPAPMPVEEQDDDGWETGDVVQEFSPISPSTSSHLAKHTDTKTATSSTAIASHDWSDWDSFLASHTTQLPSTSTQPAASFPAAAPQSESIVFNPSDEAFFDAFDRAAKQQQLEAHRVPSPPIIDLRAVERKLESKRAASSSRSGHVKEDTAAKEDDLDFFAAFEKAPERALGRASTLQLEPSQLDDIHDARTSPMRLSAEPEHEHEQGGYFGAVSTAAGQPIAAPPEKTQKPDPSSLSAIDTSSAESTSPSSWTGSLRKTWTSLRGFSGELVSHLPSASDFLVPPEEGEPSGAGSSNNSGGGGGLFLASEERRGSGTSNGSIHRSSHEGRRGAVRSSVSAAGGSGSGASNGPMRARDLFGSAQASSTPGTLRRAPAHSASLPIAGAPGFDASSTRQWNTGHWTLDAKQAKRAVEVTLSDRRDETEAVCDGWHAARIQAALPPRLQLGRQWKLLYSLDRHGMSLATLYHRVAQGLDPSKARKVSGGVREAEGWLRGASVATKAAMGVEGDGSQPPQRVKHVGGGLSLQDAGLVVAIKDDEGNVFGAFVNERLRPQQHYYGSGECFLWKTVKRTQADQENLVKQQRPQQKTGRGENEDGVDSDASRTIETFRWTGKNDYMVLTESDFLSVGGGNGRFGLWIDGALERGVSSRCPAFENEVLCDSLPMARRRAEQRGRERERERDGEAKEEEGRFECIGLEVWAVGID